MTSAAIAASAAVGPYAVASLPGPLCLDRSAGAPPGLGPPAPPAAGRRCAGGCATRLPATRASRAGRPPANGPVTQPRRTRGCAPACLRHRAAQTPDGGMASCATPEQQSSAAASPAAAATMTFAPAAPEHPPNIPVASPEHTWKVPKSPRGPRPAHPECRSRTRAHHVRRGRGLRRRRGHDRAACAAGSGGDRR